MSEIKNRFNDVRDREKWAARGATFVGKIKATKVVWFPPKPVETGKKAASKAKEGTTRTAKKTAGTAKKTTGAAKKKTTGGTKKATGAAKKTTSGVTRAAGGSRRQKKA